MRACMGLSLHQPARAWDNSRRRTRPAPGRSHPRERGTGSPIARTATPSPGNRLRDHAPCRHRHLHLAARLMRPPAAAHRFGHPIGLQVSLTPQQRIGARSPPGGTGTTPTWRTSSTSTIGGTRARQCPRQRRLITPSAVCLLGTSDTARGSGSSASCDARHSLTSEQAHWIRPTTAWKTRQPKRETSRHRQEQRHRLLRREAMADVDEGRQLAAPHHR